MNDYLTAFKHPKSVLQIINILQCISFVWTTQLTNTLMNKQAGIFSKKGVSVVLSFPLQTTSRCRKGACALAFCLSLVSWCLVRFAWRAGEIYIYWVALSSSQPSWPAACLVPCATECHWSVRGKYCSEFDANSSWTYVRFSITSTWDIECRGHTSVGSWVRK